jgi:hypothetical protein
MGVPHRSRAEASRIIDTSLYLPGRNGVGVAWFPGDNAFPLNPGMLLQRVIIGVPDESTYWFVGAVLERGQPDVNKSGIKNRWEVEKILKSKVVIEQSPPIALPLGKLLLKAPGVAIGIQGNIFRVPQIAEVCMRDGDKRRV